MFDEGERFVESTNEYSAISATKEPRKPCGVRALNQSARPPDTGWALPEEAPGPSAASPYAGLASPDVPPGAEAPQPTHPDPVPTLPVFSRPLTLADVLDGAFQVIKARPRTVVSIAAWFVVPVGLLIAVADVGVLGGDVISTLTDPETYEEGSTNSDGDFGFSILSTLVSSALITLMAAPIGRLVEGWRQGIELGVRGAFQGVGTSWWAVVVSFVLVHLLEAVGAVLLVLPGLAAMVLMLVVTPVVAVERVGPLRAMRRSFQLVRRRFWSVLWIALLVAVVSNTLSLMLPLLPVALTALFGFGGEQYVAAVGTVAASLLILPFVASAAVMTYFDLRVRSEGLDLEHALHEQFGHPE